MNKIWIVIRREYLNIITKKSFLIATLLLPLAMVGFMALEIAFISMVEKEDYTVLIPADKASIFQDEEYKLVSSTNLKYEIVNMTPDQLDVRINENEGEIWINPPQRNQIEELTSGDLTIRGPIENSIGDATAKEIKKQVAKKVQRYRLRKLGLSEKDYANMKFALGLNTEKVDKEGKKKRSNTTIAMGIGFAIGGLMLMLVMIYSGILMQGVIEEKTNRIVEVIVSSIKPFHLLLGKITGLASVALTQLLIWGVLVSIILLVAAPYMPQQDPAQAAEQMEQMKEMQAAGGMDMEGFIYDLKNFDWSVLIVVPFFFIGGFFIYGSLYAAAASAVDNIQDAQQFVMPVSMMGMLGFFIVMNLARNPNSSLAVFGSFFPLFSPMAMPARMAVGHVPWYEVLLSLALLVLGFFAVMWVAAKVYRTGILMYGKKASLKELFRWIRN